VCQPPLRTSAKVYMNVRKIQKWGREREDVKAITRNIPNGAGECHN